jgi:rod shape-determining protein MreC
VAVRPKPRNTRLLLVVLISISLATITLDYGQGESGPLASLGRAAVELMAPLQKGVTTVTRPIGDFFSNLAHLPSLAEKNRELQAEVDALKAQLALTTTKDLQLQELTNLL